MDKDLHQDRETQPMSSALVFSVLITIDPAVIQKNEEYQLLKEEEDGEREKEKKRKRRRKAARVKRERSRGRKSSIN